SLVLFVLPHYERVKSTRIRWKSDFHFPRPEVELNFSIESLIKKASFSFKFNAAFDIMKNKV
ncbi:hypothetical protein, partial [Holdemania massiliensis]|uniref:hypothetical protein n=1 Tax=Holdemania massiliensis TaxID=1468449 RepID=UPI0019D59638